MIDKIFSKVVSFLQPRIELSISYSIIYTIILAKPDYFIVLLGLEYVFKQYKEYFSLLYLIALSHMLYKLIRHYYDIFQKRLLIKNLSIDEKLVLKEYVEQGKTVVHGDICSGILPGLEAKGLIFRSSILGVPGSLQTFPFNIQPWILIYLKKHKKLLD